MQPIVDTAEVAPTRRLSTRRSSGNRSCPDNGLSPPCIKPVRTDRGPEAPLRGLQPGTSARLTSSWPAAWTRRARRPLRPPPRRRHRSRLPRGDVPPPFLRSRAVVRLLLPNRSSTRTNVKRSGAACWSWEARANGLSSSFLGKAYRDRRATSTVPTRRPETGLSTRSGYFAGVPPGNDPPPIPPPSRRGRHRQRELLHGPRYHRRPW